MALASHTASQRFEEWVSSSSQLVSPPLVVGVFETKRDNINEIFETARAQVLGATFL